MTHCDTREYQPTVWPVPYVCTQPYHPGGVSLCKDHRDKTEVPDSLVVEDPISEKLNNGRKSARLNIQYRDIISNNSEGTAFFLQVVT